MSLNTYSIVLRPSGPLKGLPSSDTLFGALCWGIRYVYGVEELTELLQGFEQHALRFMVSSGFWAFCDGAETVRLFPRPISEICRLSNETRRERFLRHRFLKTPYVTETVLRQITEGKLSCVKDAYARWLSLRKERPTLWADVWCNEDEASHFLKPLYKHVHQQHNSLSPDGSSEETFYVDAIYTADVTRVHFLMKASSIDLLEPVFRYLEGVGIGGDRTVGRGAYEFESWDEYNMPDGGSKEFMVLSRYIPYETEIQWDQQRRNRYRIGISRSRVESDQEFSGESVWKESVKYVEEGSTLMATESKQFFGRLIKVKEIDGISIFQHGFSIPLFLPHSKPVWRWQG